MRQNARDVCVLCVASLRNVFASSDILTNVSSRAVFCADRVTSFVGFLVGRSAFRVRNLSRSPRNR